MRHLSEAQKKSFRTAGIVTPFRVPEIKKNKKGVIDDSITC